MDSDRVVLITGATGDFGPYVCRAFAAFHTYCRYNSRFVRGVRCH